MHKSNLITTLINAAIFILLEIAALSILRNNAPLQDTWFAKGGQAFMKTVWGLSQNVSDYFSLKSQNDSLAQENFRLKAKLEALEAHIADSILAAKIYSKSDIDGFRFIPAKILKISDNSQHNYLIINRGEADGIEKGTGVITEQGAIGVIDAVSKNFSFARSFKNHGMNISARLGSNGAAGPLSWDGIHSNVALLKEIPHHIAITPGDTVYTSGYSSIFPADIPLGVVESSHIVNGSTHNIKVVLFEDLTSLKYVTIVQNLNKDEIKALEEMK